MVKDIEVEIRTFLEDDQYDNIKKKLSDDFEFERELDEITIYFSGEKDLRIRKNNEEAFLILKEGKIHDDFRKEFEIRFDLQDFEKMINIFLSLGFSEEIKWIRKRYEYRSDDIKILLDNTKGYGKILELEKMSEAGGEEEARKGILKVLSSLGIEKVTPKEEFDKRYKYYSENWRNLIV